MLTSPLTSVGKPLPQSSRRGNEADFEFKGFTGSGRGPVPGLVLTLTWLLSGGAAFGQGTNLVSLSSSLPETGFSVLRVFGSLVLVLALFLGGVWVYRNWQRLAVKQGRAPKLNVLEVKSLGNRQALYVVGYEQQRLLVAAAPSGVTLLTHLPEAEPGVETPTPAPTFAQSLQQVLGARG